MKSLLIMILIATTTAVFAQTKPSPKPFRFSPNVDQLPPRYAGQFGDLWSVYKIRTQVNGKGEYETYAEFERRLGSVDTAIRRLLGNGPFSIVFTPELTYDADLEAFEIVGKFGGHRLLVGTAKKAGKSYVGQNAFGVRKRISTAAYHNYYVEVLNRKDLPSDVGPGNIGNIEMQLLMGRTEAVKAKPNLRMLLVGQPVEPFFSADSSEQTPTIDDPEHSVIWTSAVYMTISEVWLFDYPTGHIWAKWQKKESSK